MFDKEYTITFMSMKNYLVYNLLIDAARKHPKNFAIHEDSGSLTFEELLGEVEKLKTILLTEGIQPGMGVGVMARNSSHFIIAVFAVLGCGAGVMPVSHQLKQPEIEEILDVARLHAIIDDQSGVIPPVSFSKEVDVVKTKLRIGFSEISKDEIFASHVEAPAFIRFTSGTTGRSKGVVIGNQSVLERISAANMSLQLNEKSNVVWVLPMAYHFVVSIVLYIKVGAAITIVPNFLAKSVIEMTNRFKGIMLYASPMQIRLLSADIGQEKMNSLQKIISTSSGISPEISKQFQKRFGIVVHQAFGIIEVGLPIINTEQGEEFLDAVGYALPDYDVQVLSEDNTILQRNTVGKLAIKGPGMFDAYLEPAILRQEILINGYFLSNDYAIIDDSGMIRIVGRGKSMINISGNKVFAEEVEQVLESHSSIEKALVKGVSHPLMGQIIQADVVLSENSEIDIEEVLTYCRKRLSTFKIPQSVRVVKELRMTKTGKVARG